MSESRQCVSSGVLPLRHFASRKHVLSRGALARTDVRGRLLTGPSRSRRNIVNDQRHEKRKTCSWDRCFDRSAIELKQNRLHKVTVVTYGVSRWDLKSSYSPQLSRHICQSSESLPLFLQCRSERQTLCSCSPTYISHTAGHIWIWLCTAATVWVPSHHAVVTLQMKLKSARPIQMIQSHTTFRRWWFNLNLQRQLNIVASLIMDLAKSNTNDLGSDVILIWP